jgi:hypothetical protein
MSERAMQPPSITARAGASIAKTGRARTLCNSAEINVDASMPTAAPTIPPVTDRIRASKTILETTLL